MARVRKLVEPLALPDRGCAIPAGITRASWANHDMEIAIPQRDGVLSLLKAGESRPHCSIPVSIKSLWVVAWSPDDRLLAVGARDNCVHIVDVARQEVVRKFQGHIDDVHGLAWALDGNVVYSASFDGSLKAWSLSSLDSGPIRSVRAHDGRVVVLAAAPSGTLYSGGHDGFVRSWDPTSLAMSGEFLAHPGAFVLDLEICAPRAEIVSTSSDRSARVMSMDLIGSSAEITGFEGVPHAVAVSADAQYLALRDDLRSLHVFRMDTLEHVACYQVEAGHANHYGSLQFHPTVGRVLTSAGGDRSIHEWAVDDLAARVAELEAGFYCTARVGIVGATGAGKSALAAALRSEPFEATVSTHGTGVSLLRREMVDEGSRRILREVFLWDFAGQSSYRLMQHRDIANLDCIVFAVDNREAGGSLDSVLDWDAVIRTAGSPSGRSAPRVLALSRIDRGRPTLGIDSPTWSELLNPLKATVETSAKEGRGIKALQDAVLESIPWGTLPRALRPQSVIALRQLAIRLVSEGHVAVSLGWLRGRYRTETGARDLDESSFLALVEALEAQDAVTVLPLRRQVLLQPARLRGYEASLLRAAEEDPDGCGVLRADRLRRGDVYLPEEDRCHDEETHKDLIYAAMDTFLDAGVAFRQAGGDVCFPTCAVRPPDETCPSAAVRIRFVGVLDRVWARIVCAAAAAHLPNGVIVRRDAFEVPATQLRVSLTREKSASGIVAVASAAGRDLPVPEFITDQLRDIALGYEIEEMPLSCHACGYAVDSSVAKHRRLAGKKWVTCQICDERIPLPDLLVPSARSAEGGASADGDAAMTPPPGDPGRVLQYKQDRELYDVWISYRKNDYESIRPVLQRLTESGIRYWIDRECLRPGVRWVDEIDGVLSRIPTALVFIGNGGPGDWQSREIEALLSNTSGTTIPVLLTGVPISDMPTLLRQHHAVRVNPLEDAVQQLYWGITGRRMEH